MASSARIDELRKKFDENPRRYFAPLANEYRKAGDLEQAIFICQEYLPQQPGHMSGHIVYGQALFELARFDEARQVFETALSLDPENLIALRHLGDIARQSGDSRTARGWYQRVLEADPRNEEIAQIMMSLLATPAAAQMVVSPSSTPVGTAAVSDALAVGFEPTSLSFEVEKSTDGSDLAVGPELGALPGRQTPAAPVLSAPVWTPAAARIPEHELLDINDFTIGGVPITQIGTTPSIDQPPAEPDAFTEAHDAFVSETVATPSETTPAFAVQPPVIEAPDFEIERIGESFEADPFAIAAAAAPAEELATDIALGLPGDDLAPTVSAPDDSAVLGFETFEPGIEALPASEPIDIETSADFDAIFDVPSTTEWQNEPTAEGEVAEPVDVPASEAPTSFVALDSEPAATFGTDDLAAAPTLDPFASEASTPDSTFDPVASEAASSPTPTFDPFDSFPPATFDAPEREQPSADESGVQEPAALSAFDPTPLESFDLPIEPDVMLAADSFTSFDAIEAIAAPELDTVEAFDVTPEPPAQTFELPALPNDGSVLDAAILADANDFAGIETPIAGIDAQPIAPVSEPYVPSYAQNPTPIITPAIEMTMDTPPIPAAFVTETMAELYLQQGHLDSALEIYHRLVAQRPEDAALRDRLRVLESQTAAGASHATSVPPAPVGPTIREFLTSLVWPQPAAEAPDAGVAAVVAPDFDDVHVDGPPSIDEEFGAAVDPYATPVMSALAIVADDFVVDISSTAETPLSSPAIEAIEFFGTPAAPAASVPEPSESERATPVTRGTPAVASETVRGSIDALFSGADASTTDASAASTLAQAFAPESQDSPLRGMPAHKAESELSLDHVFKTGPSPRPSGETEAFSFDQFFADDMLDGGKGTGDAPAAPGQGDDIAQFNNWLNGLKKT